MSLFTRLPVRLSVFAARLIGSRPLFGPGAGPPASRPEGLDDLRDQLEADIVSSALSARLAATVVHRGFAFPHRVTPEVGPDPAAETASYRVGLPDGVIYEIEAVVERLSRALTGLDCVWLGDEGTGPPDATSLEADPGLPGLDLPG